MFYWINTTYFVISFCIGIMFVYIMNPPLQVVYKFPSPDNEDIIYNDESESCYKYQSEEVPCSDKTVNQPIVENFEKKK